MHHTVGVRLDGTARMTAADVRTYGTVHGAAITGFNLNSREIVALYRRTEDAVGHDAVFDTHKQACGRRITLRASTDRRPRVPRVGPNGNTDVEMLEFRCPERVEARDGAVARDVKVPTGRIAYN